MAVSDVAVVTALVGVARGPNLLIKMLAEGLAPCWCFYL